MYPSSGRTKRTKRMGENARAEFYLRRAYHHSLIRVTVYFFSLLFFLLRYLNINFFFYFIAMYASAGRPRPPPQARMPF